MSNHRKSEVEDAERKARREFLVRCGRFAAVTPPMMTTLLTVSSLPREAQASTIGPRRGRGPRNNGGGLVGTIISLLQ
jgi:hypothetical protein